VGAEAEWRAKRGFSRCQPQRVGVSGVGARVYRTRRLGPFPFEVVELNRKSTAGKNTMAGTDHKTIKRGQWIQHHANFPSTHLGRARHARLSR
jgi:hypothetical protein